MLLGELAKEKGTRNTLSLTNSAVYQFQTSMACPVPFTWKKRDARIEASAPSQSLQKHINIASTATFAITVRTNSMELANTSAIAYSNIIAIFVTTATRTIIP
ncbi:hypothetical protein E2I00_005740 [Balaenoptera physalus]|uniref:Uncharacterized protein n=1 Tax=Balaenoptera physalus TaxID=9770 RepID=A0A6A1Q6Z3_BALPH|nr:hypothetical protein E2I00_005740 [Balaenoptera physalus]